MDFIELYNKNSVFISSIMSAIGLIISIVAIVVSVRTAKLPYKKRLKMSIVEQKAHPSGNRENSVGGIKIKCVNVGNKSILLNFFGICAKKNLSSNGSDGVEGEWYRIEGIRLESIAPEEVKTIFIPIEKLRKSFATANKKDKIYIYVKDSEGKEYYKKIMNYSEFYELYLKD